MNWKTVGLTIVASASLTLSACGVDNNETGQGLDNGVQQTRFGNTTDFPTNDTTRLGTDENRNGAGMMNDGNSYGRDARNDYLTRDYDNGTRNGFNERNINNQADMNNNNNGTPNYGLNRNADTMNNNNNGDNNNRNGNNNNNNNENRFEVADEAADRIEQEVDDVDNVYVLTTNNNAYVAVELDNGARNGGNAGNVGNGNNLGNGDNVSNRIEREIRDAVKAVDRDIDNVYVSTNPDFVDLTNNFRDGANNGEPIEGFFDQMGAMIERVFPDRR
ncbi:YhcN/YlaJ family sporulation lipoprotein [Aquibacillus halophilus]|uniref:YhcN/YlaJ family sporulation lipoprotein n=1 Tax=Aquibacillus halophilus TaxID=930132 RepID=A0A6A8DGX4_9BACI|nr:YhcN/YlaJ family sporulation lipoprotein [Aquibacillus halophilus]MRH44923.1 YhcN/YlaJ family sporulation lipoprotein [Aquibacillus halophilus]